NLANLYREQSRYAEAETTYARALAIRERKLGSDSLEVGSSLTRMAELYQDMGRDREAEKLISRAIDIRLKRLGEQNPDVGTSMSVLARIKEKRGHRLEAEKLYRRSLSIAENALGPDNPDLATNRSNLGAFLKSEGRHDEAYSLLQSALAVREKTLPPDHPAIATSLLQLAELYRLQGRTDEAHELFKRAFGMRKAAIKEVPVLFGTDRNLDTTAKSIVFGNARAAAGKVTLGIAKVTLSKQQVSSPRPAANGKDAEEITDVQRLEIQPLQIESAAQLVQLAKQLRHGAQAVNGSALVFVHGYNVSFENAIRRAGQIAYDLNFDGPVFVFSWPSRGRLTGYISDRDTVDVAARHF